MIAEASEHLRARAAGARDREAEHDAGDGRVDRAVERPPEERAASAHAAALRTNARTSP
jgi:hypothetical protein